MAQDENYWLRRLRSGQLSRRRFMGGAAALGAGAAGLALVGCGDDDNGSKTATSAATTAAASASSSAAASATTASSGGTAAAGSVDQIRQLLNLPTGKGAGEGLNLNVGSVLALSESGSYYGGVMSKGIDLAVEQIKALGGPTFKVTYKDHKSGNAEAGAAAARELGIAKTPMCLASYSADIGAMLPGIEQYKMFTLDGGGGAASAFQGKPYFYGTRAVTPDDTYDGVYQYVKQKLPNAKSVQLVIWDLGEATIKPSEDRLKAVLAKDGFNYLGYETAPIGATDFSTLLARVKQKNPDIIHLGIWGLDPGFFMKQFVTSGINSQIIGSEFTPDAAKVAGDAYNKYTFAFDFFNPDAPTNPWANIFVNTWKKKYPDVVPDFYAADYYENTFNLWELVTRAIAAGDDPNNGDNINKALNANPKLSSVYGGDSTKVGDIGIDLKTHSVNKRAMGVFQIKDGKPSMVASFDIGGAGFKLI